MTLLCGWQSRLASVVDVAQTKKFSYGIFDCALFVADCVVATTGIDYAESLRGYTSKTDAYRIISEYGSMEAMLSKLLNKAPSHPAFAQPGDVVLATLPLSEGEQGEAIGICLGTRFAFASLIGLRMAGIKVCNLSWRVN